MLSEGAAERMRGASDLPSEEPESRAHRTNAISKVHSDVRESGALRAEVPLDEFSVPLRRSLPSVLCVRVQRLQP